MTKCTLLLSRVDMEGWHFMVCKINDNDDDMVVVAFISIFAACIIISNDSFTDQMSIFMIFEFSIVIHPQHGESSKRTLAITTVVSSFTKALTATVKHTSGTRRRMTSHNDGSNYLIQLVTLYSSSMSKIGVKDTTYIHMIRMQCVLGYRFITVPSRIEDEQTKYYRRVERSVSLV
jgi:hypothetical protein